MTDTIVSLCGYQGSGKSTLGCVLAETLGVQHFETSHLVMQTIGEMARHELSATAELTKDNPNWLGEALYEKIKLSENPVAVLTGVRELEVHQYFENKHVTVKGFEISAPPQVRMNRLLALKKVKNASEFIEQDLREKAMGLDQVIKSAEFIIPTGPDTNPNSLVRGIVAVLKKIGVLI